MTDSAQLRGSPAGLLGSRGILLVCGVIVFLLTAMRVCGGYTAGFISVLLSDGMVAAWWVGGACALGAVVLRLLRVRINAYLFWATAGGLGLGIFSLLGLLLGLAGGLNRSVAIAFPCVSILLWLAGLLRSRQRPLLDRWLIIAWLRQPAGAAWLWLVPVISLALAAVSASEVPGILWKPLDPHPYDVTGYHLLVPREWYERGRIVPLEHNVYSYFEFNVEMQFLLLMHAMGGPWVAMYACQFMCVGYAGLMVLAVVGASSEKAEREEKDERRTSNFELRTSKSQSAASVRSSKFDVRCSMFAFSSFLAAAITATVPWFIMLAGVAYVESALMLYTALAIAWGLYAIRHTEQLVKSLVIAGVMAGFACGVKITAVPMLLLAVPVAVFAVLMIRRPAALSARRLMIGCGALVLVGSLVVSPWLIRNFVWAGNPLFPVGMSVLGQDHFDEVQKNRFQVAHSPVPANRPFAARLKLVWIDVLGHWQFGYVIFPAALVALAWRWRDRHTWMILICGLFVGVVWIGFTHLLPRFLVMLIPIAGIAIGRVRWGRVWPAGVTVLLASAWFGFSAVMPELRKQIAASPLIGLGDLSVFVPPELADARDRGLQIGLVGDAQAFLFPIPLRQMHYRAVFNLNTKTDDPVMAWIGPAPIGDANWLLMINPTEIDRLHNTYRGVPGLPPDWAAHWPAVFYLRGDQLTKK